MKSKNKILLWISGITGSVMALNAGSLQFTTDTRGTTTKVVINYNEDDGSVKKEEVVLNKAGKSWVLVRKDLQDDAHFNVKGDQDQNAKFFVDGLEFELHLNLELYVRGTYEGNLLIDHSNKVTIGTKNGPLTVNGTFFINKAKMFENRNTLTVDENWLCLLTAVKNSGTITVKQGWQVMSLQTFENATSGKFTMQQTDILSPGTKITNKGQINCVLDFNGAPCDFTNHAGEVCIGGNATLKSLVNKSETEPVVGGFYEAERSLIAPNGIAIQPSDRRYFLRTYAGGLKFDPKDSCCPSNYAWGFRDSCLGCKRIITNVQNFTRKEGKRALFTVHNRLVLKQSSQTVCSSICASTLEGAISLKGYATNKQVITYVLKNTAHRYFSGNFFGDGARTVYWDSFVHSGTQISLKELISSKLEVLGTVTGKVETFVNGKADKAQPGVVKATQAALAQHKAKLEQIAQDADILPMLADPEVYAAELQELKANPVFATMVRLQEKRKLTSATTSAMPSRMGSPGLN